MLKDLLKDALRRGYKWKEGAPIFLEFSAGCDSTALFWAMYDMVNEFPFTCVTYYYQQPKIYLNKIHNILKDKHVPLKVFALTTEQVLANIEELKSKGFKGRVLLDCLAGNLPITKALNNSIVVNGSFADVLYGSYFFQFKPTMTHEEFNAQRLKLLAKPDQDGVDSLNALLKLNNNFLLTPFKDEAIVNYFLSKTFAECGGTTKLLFKNEFAEELKTLKYKVNRMAQQIESGIRDLRKTMPRKED